MDPFLCLKLKVKLNGLRFDTTVQISGSSQKVLNTVQEPDFKQTFQKSQRAETCTNWSQGILVLVPTYT